MCVACKDDKEIGKPELFRLNLDKAVAHELLKLDEILG
jgi:hypothetical protein